ncbi:MAG: Crp/Fnr family transcriptional regulator [Zoogloeaceae bacterium]|jgi:CRP-like cAMP-binding protein|nr:Crp/Fnr family transcriptional regulator [Zoogloeaceae bacterium]
MNKTPHVSYPDSAHPPDTGGETRSSGTPAAPASVPVPAAGGKTALTIRLQNIPLLRGLEPEVLKQMVGGLQIKQAGRGALILHKGGAGDHLLFLLAGRLQAIDTNEEGKEIGLSFILPGDYFGELSIVDGQPRSASVVACETSLIALLPRRQAQMLIYHHPLVAERVLKRMAASVRQASSYRAILGISNAFQRVFALLHHLASVVPGGLVVIDQMPTQQEIAIMVNTSRETVSRALSILIKRGVVEKDLRRLIVRRPEVLREAAIRKDTFGPDPGSDGADVPAGDSPSS